MVTHIFTPVDQLTGKRLCLHITSEDLRKVGRGGKWSATITNTEDGRVYDVQGAPCSFKRCYCDAVAREVGAA